MDCALTIIELSGEALAETCIPSLALTKILPILRKSKEMWLAL